MRDQDKDTRPGRCTGPRSATGKQNSSRNSTTHGLSCKKFLLIPGEKEEEYKAHAQHWLDEYKEHSSPVLDMLLQDVIEAHWLVKRAALLVLQSESAFSVAEINKDGSAPEVFKCLRNMQRYKTSYENTFHKALRAVEAFCKNRLAAELTQHRIRHVVASTVAATMKSMVYLVKACKLTPEEARESAKELFPSPVGQNSCPADAAQAEAKQNPVTPLQ